MATYVDGFVIPIKKKNLPAYRKLAKLGAKVWMEHGALQYVEAVGDELKTKMLGAPFPKMAKLKAGETLVFSFIVYESKAHRNRVNNAAMKDARLAALCDPKKMPFDMKRMAMGGFKSFVEAAKR